MANSISLSVQDVKVLGKGDDGVRKYLIGIRLAYNKVIETPIQVEVLNPDWAEGQEDPDDPPKFLLEDQIELSYELLFSGDYKIEAKHNAADLQAQLLAIKDQIQADIDKYKDEALLKGHNVLTSRVAQLEGLLQA